MVSIQLGFHVLKINDLKPLFLVIDLCFIPEGAWAGLVAAVGCPCAWGQEVLEQPWEMFSCAQ